MYESTRRRMTAPNSFLRGKKRKRLVGLDLGESLREKLDWSQALEYEWDLHKQR